MNPSSLSQATTSNIKNSNETDQPPSCGEDDDSNGQISQAMPPRSGSTSLLNIGQHDVMLGRNKEAHSNPGNEVFRRLIQRHREGYQQARFRQEKKAITLQVMDAVRQLGGTFLKFNPTDGTYQPVADGDCYEKVSHALRSARSSKQTTTPLPPARESDESTSEKQTKCAEQQSIRETRPPRHCVDPDQFLNLLDKQREHFRLLCLDSQENDDEEEHDPSTGATIPCLSKEENSSRTTTATASQYSTSTLDAEILQLLQDIV